MSEIISGYKPMDLARKDEVLNRIRLFELELSEVLNIPVSVVAYAPSELPPEFELEHDDKS